MFFSHWLCALARRQSDRKSRKFSHRNRKSRKFSRRNLAMHRSASSIANVAEALEDRTLLTTFYVDDSLVITNDQGAGGLDAGDEVTFAFGEAGETTGLIFGTNAFDTINNAVTAAADSGDTIQVAAGTYSGLISLNKSVDLLGANAGIDPNAMARAAESIIDHDGFYAIQPTAEDITIDGFSFEGNGGRVIDSFASANNLTIANNIFNNTNIPGGQGGIQLQSGSFYDLTVEQNLFQFTGDGDALVVGGGGSFERMHIVGNHFAGTTRGIFQNGGTINDAVVEQNEFTGSVGMNMGDAGNIQIRENTFDGNFFTGFQVGTIDGEIVGNTFQNIEASPGFFGQAFELWGGQFGTTVSENVTIENNVIHYNDVAGAAEPTHGIRLRLPDGGSGIDASTIHINNNAFLDGGVRGDAKAIRHFGDQTTAVDASRNWWGTTNESSIAALMEDADGGTPLMVDFTPFLDNGTDTDLGTAGFQGDFSTLNVTTLGSQTGGVGRIQEAIDSVSFGGTINVAAGTYAEDVIVDTSVILQGANAGIAGNGVRGPESRIDPSSPFGIEVRADNVTIDGFEITGLDRDGINVRPTNSGPGTSTRQNIVIQNNYIHETLVPGNQVNGIVFGEKVGGGPDSADMATISFVTISDNLIDVTDDNTARGMVMTGHFASIHYDNFDITGNVIQAKNNGIFFSENPDIYTANGIEILENTFETPGSLGINAGNFDSTSKVNGNTFINNASGAALNFAEPGGEVLNNTFENHTNVGLFFYDATFFPQSSENPTVTGNIFTNNSRQVGAPALAVDLDAIQNNNTFDGGVRVSSNRNLYGNIQDAIDNAMPGDDVTVVINATYTENVDVNQAVTLMGEATVNGSVTASVAGATIAPGFSPGIFASTDLILTAGSSLNVEIDGNSGAGVAGGHSQFVTTGNVNLGGATLDTTDSDITGAMLGDTFEIIDVGGTLTGTFAGLANGDTVLVNGQTFRIFYDGGDGNDVVLTFLPPVPVPVTYVDTTFTGVNGTFITDADPNQIGDQNAVIGVNAFDTIQEGIDAVVATGTVIVNAGTYSGNVGVDKTVTIQGANAGIAAGVDPGVRGPESELTGGFRLLANDVVIDGLKIVDGAGPAGIGSKSAVFMTTGTTGHTIENNILEGPGMGVESRGVLSTFNGNNDNITIQNNEIYDWIAGIHNQGNTNVNIFGNNIHNVVAGVANDFVADVSIEGNAFSNALEGIGVFNNISNGIPDVVAHDNFFDSSTLTNPIAHYGGDTVDASGNWWGSTDETTIANSMKSDSVDGDASKVDFTPFLESGTDTELGTPGFQGDFSTLYVTTLGDQTGATGRIQEAVDLVSNSEILLEDGTYNESVNINRPDLTDLTLRGRNGVAANVIIDAGGSDGITATDPATITIQDLRITNADNGLDIDGLTTLNLTNLLIDGSNSGGAITNIDTLNFTSTDNGESIDVTPTTLSATGIQAISQANISTLNIDSLDGDDLISVEFGAGLPPTINIDAGDPMASDELTVLGSPGNDTITVTGTTVDDGSSTINLTNIEDLIIDVSQDGIDDVIVDQPFTGASNSFLVTGGGSGDDELVVNAPTGLFAQTIDVDADSVDVHGEPLVVDYNDIDFLVVNGDDGNDIFNVQPSQATEITINGGNPQFGDVGVPPGDTLNFDPLGNTFNIVGKTIFTAGGMPDPYKGVNFVGIENLPLEPIGPDTLRFDLDGGGLETQAGYTSVAGGQVYGSGAVGSDFGWVGGSVSTIDRGNVLSSTFENLLQDGHYGTTPRTFRADVTNGWYLVSVKFGDAIGGRDNVRVTDADSGNILLDSVTSAVGQFEAETFVVQVFDGSLDLEFSDLGGNAFWVVNGIEIRPAEILTIGTPDPGPLAADGGTIDTFTGYEATPGSLVTISTTHGEVTSTDLDADIAGIQVLADAFGEFTYHIRRPTGGVNGLVKMEEVTGEQTGCLVIEYVLPNLRRFDFNVLGSPTQEPVNGFPAGPTQEPGGYIGIEPADLYSSDIGFGWLSSVSSFDRGSLGSMDQGDLRRDGHYNSSDRVFRTDLPDGTFLVNVTIGDHIAGRNDIQVRANGVLALDDIDTAPGEFFQGSFLVTVSGGVLDLEFSDLGGNPFWVVNGLEIREQSLLDSISFDTAIPGGDVSADGTTVTTVNGMAPVGLVGELITLDSSLGTILSDDSSAYIGTQVRVAAGGAFSFDILAPTSGGTPTLSAVSVDGSATGEQTNAAFLNYVGLPTQLFDFNAPGSPTQTPSSPPNPVGAGYVEVLSTDLYNALDGYGWVTTGPAVSFDRGPGLTGAQSDLRRDGHYDSVAREFQVDLPNGTYYVNVTIGDQLGARDNIRVRNLDTAADLLPDVDTAAGEFFHDILFPVTVTDGSLNLEFSDLGGNSFWVLNGLEIRPDITAVNFNAIGAQPADGGTDNITGTASVADGTLLTITTDIGTILSDASSEYAGTQVVVTGGAFSFDIQSPVSDGIPTIVAEAVDGSARGEDNTVVSYTAPAVDKLFDLNRSPTQAGYTGVLASDLYDPVAGYGWVTNAARGADRGALAGSTHSDLLRDIHYGTGGAGTRTFQADLAASTEYEVTVTFGDSSARDNMTVEIPVGFGTGVGLNDVDTTAGQYSHRTFTATTNGSGNLQLEFSDAGGDAYWTISGIAFRVAATVGDLTVDATDTGGNPVAADGATEDTFTVTGATVGALYTISTTSGTITTADADTRYAGIQVLAGAGSFTFDVLRPGSGGIADILVQEVSGAADGAVSQEYTGIPVRRFDFNGRSNETAAGFTGVRGNELYDPVAGYGWASAVRDLDRGASGYTVTTVDLYRDGAYGSAGAGSARTFQISVTPGTEYEVRVYVGDRIATRDNMEFRADGVTVIADIDAPANTFATASFIYTAGDSILDLEIRDNGGDSYWVFNGVDIAETATGLPPAAPLLIDAISPPATDTPESLTSDELALIADAAIARWNLTGLTQDQLTLLQNVELRIDNLDDGRTLGLAGTRQILIDDDAAGYGWFVDQTPYDNLEFDQLIDSHELQSTSGSAALYVDLLTVVMHELGHVLGLDDIDSSHDPNELMSDRLAPGIRRLANAAASGVATSGDDGNSEIIPIFNLGDSSDQIQSSLRQSDELMAVATLLENAAGTSSGGDLNNEQEEKTDSSSPLVFESEDEEIVDEFFQLIAFDKKSPLNLFG